VRRLADAGAWVVDVRHVEAFAAAHVPGSVSIPLRPQFASWLGWIVPDQAPVVLVLDPDQDRTDVMRQARSIGYEAVLGELDGGITAWQAAGQPTESIPLVPVAAATGAVVDVRQQPEFAAGHVPGGRNVELGGIVDAELPAGPVSLMCGHGERAMTAASLLTRNRRDGVTVLVGGPADWASAHRTLDTGS
jgi:rhodanese-related sulfurtransferase